MSKQIEVGTVLVRLNQEQVEANGGSWHFEDDAEGEEVKVVEVKKLWGGDTTIITEDFNRYTLEPDEHRLSYLTFFEVKE